MDQKTYANPEEVLSNPGLSKVLYLSTISRRAVRRFSAASARPSAIP